MKLSLCPRCEALHSAVHQLEIEQNNTVVRYRGRELRLEPMQARIFAALAKVYPGILPHERLFFALYGDRIDGGPSDKNVCVQVHRLRKRLREAGIGIRIQNSWGRGYSLEFEAENERSQAA